MKIDKHNHIESGLLIKIILASCYDEQYKKFAKNIVPGTIHEIIDRPNRRARKNGDMGVWISGTNEIPVFVRFFGWTPYVPEVKMTRTKAPEMRRIKPLAFQRIKK